MWTRRLWLGLASVGGFIAVAVGAFATHGVSDQRAADLLHTGANYGFMHCLATFACATVMSIGGRRARFAPGFFLAGVVLFSGSLYAMAFGAPNWFGAITPLGGLCFLIGWAILAWSSMTIDQAERP